MTTPNEELRKQLQQIYKSGELYYRVIPDATDLLQSKAERIAELEADRENTIAIGKIALDEATALRAELAEIAAAEPSMIYHGRCIIDCGDSGHQDVTMLKMIARETKLFTRPMPAESKDAERYRWLRDYLISPSTHFDDLIVSADKADTLDGVIDAARAKGAK